MAEKESFPSWLMHKVDRVLMPKDRADKIKAKTLERLRQEEAAKEALEAQSEANRDWKPSPKVEEDDISRQVARLKRRNALLAAAAPEGKWNK
jgi:hypothetical protein